MDGKLRNMTSVYLLREDAVLCLTDFLSHHGVTCHYGKQGIGLNGGMAVDHAVFKGSVLLGQCGCKFIP